VAPAPTWGCALLLRPAAAPCCCALLGGSAPWAAAASCTVARMRAAAASSSRRLMQRQRQRRQQRGMHPSTEAQDGGRRGPQARRLPGPSSDLRLQPLRHASAVRETGGKACRVSLIAAPPGQQPNGSEPATNVVMRTSSDSTGQTRLAKRLAPGTTVLHTPPSGYMPEAHSSARAGAWAARSAAPIAAARLTSCNKEQGGAHPLLIP
jgi:hypothetical protein